jgi:NADH:ubiquinone oxidoreductase subunit K
LGVIHTLLSALFSMGCKGSFYISVFISKKYSAKAYKTKVCPIFVITVTCQQVIVIIALLAEYLKVHGYKNIKVCAAIAQGQVEFFA